ncbi:hypothetical protein ACIBXA_30550 [Micromonospora echinaurantiaca]|uniref:hypothetical protein n=1 Tax=Micromonospora echinaurantiaca TaxID=47857 RepID=UPI0037973A50
MRRSTTSTTDTRAAASGNSVTGPPQTPRAVRLRFGRTVLISLLAMASGVGLMAPPATAA